MRVVVDAMFERKKKHFKIFSGQDVFRLLKLILLRHSVQGVVIHSFIRIRISIKCLRLR